MLTISTDDFERNWKVCDYDETMYTDGNIRGVVVYDDKEYTVIKLVK